MDLAKEQEFQAKLYVDAEFRARFFYSTKEVAIAFGLRGGALDRAMKLDEEQVCNFARSLLQKRWLEIPKFLPRTHKVLGSRLRKMFIEYAANNTLSGIHKHTVDALAFARYLNTILDATPELTYELARLEALHSKSIWLFRCTRLREPMSQGPRSRFVFWWRIGNNHLREFWI